jgi:hypothetical protein
MTPDLSVVIPVYNRGELIRYTLESVRRASVGLAVETIVVDDGSAVPAAESISRLGYAPTLIHRQENRGLLFARLAGSERASGRYLLFLDSDDLVGPDKFCAQIRAMDRSHADVSYSDQAEANLVGDYDRLEVRPEPPLRATDAPADFFLRIQPAPHGPIFRTSYLRGLVAGAFFPPSSRYNSVAEIWFYYNAAPRAAAIQYVPGPHTIIGRHPGARLTNHWENLGLASLRLSEAFFAACPRTPETRLARVAAGECAFNSWRRLPRDFSAGFDTRLLKLWRSAPRGPLQNLGERRFQRLARVLGPELTGRFLRFCFGHTYASCRTLTDAEYHELLAAHD